MNTLKSKVMVSIEMTALRAKFCRVPVRKACGKKNPEIQNTEGMPLSIHSLMNWILVTRSVTHAARGFRLG